MKPQSHLLIVFLILFTQPCISQNVSVRFFKDPLLTREVKEKKANYRLTETIEDNGVRNLQVFNLWKDCPFREMKYCNDTPCGKWELHSVKCEHLNTIYYDSTAIDTVFDNTSNVIGAEYERAYIGENENGIYDLIFDRLVYPEEAKSQGITGVVFVQLMIHSDGDAEIVSILTGAHLLLDASTWEIFQNMPKWTPAKKNGLPINSVLTVHVAYKLW